MVAPARTPVCTNRLRSLNEPREVRVATVQVADAGCQLPADCQPPAARCPLPATTQPMRVDANGQCEETSNEGKGAKRAAGSGQQAADISSQQAANNSGQLAANNSGLQTTTDTFSLPRALWLNDTLKTVDAIREIWEIEDEWWRDHIARRYFDVILDGGKHLVIYQDRLTGKWFAQMP